MKPLESSLKKLMHPLRTPAAVAVALALSICLSAKAAFNPVDEPLPMVGTDGHGHTYPGATVPFGMVQVSPDTRTETWDGCSGYHYSDSTILGFSHTHLSGTGCGCLGDVMLMPGVGKVYWDDGVPGNGYASKFSHTQETATPGYYRVYLETPKVNAELTATERCGFHKYTFPASDQSHIILDLAHGIGNSPVEEAVHIENQQTVSGYRISDGWGGKRVVYFVIEFSKPFDSSGIEQNGMKVPSAFEGRGKSVKAVFHFKTGAGEAVMAKVGVSGTGIDGAKKNLAAEIPSWNFDKACQSAKKAWQTVFDTVNVKTFDPHIARTFYANFYLSCLAPVLFNDVDGTYRGYDHQNHTGAKFQNYTTFSIWDIYRAEWPLLTLVHPSRVNDMVQSMLAEYDELGQHTTPIWPLWANETWCMIGYHSVDMIAEAYLEGFRGFDAEQAYQAMRDTAMQDRNGLSTYKTLGYVASKPGEQATSKTIEYTIDDWSIAKMAEALGHADDAKLFYKRSANYYNLFDRTVEFFRGRKADGKWRFPFSDISLVGDEYTEADAWQYAFAVQHDVPGMMALYGGEPGFVRKMDTLFTTNSFIDTGIPDITGLIGQDSQGDEQCHHVPYLYDYAGAPYKAQQRLREIMSQLYNDTPSGQCGNADCGQMSAWYVFSALGFYPVNPSSGIFALGSPVVTKAVIQLDHKIYHGKKFTVMAENNSADNIYIQSVTLNGKTLDRPWITRKEVTDGGTLKFVMGPKPNTEWGAAPANRPPATMPAGFQYPQLPEPAPTSYVVNYTLPIRIACGGDKPVGEFVPDEDMIYGNANRSDSQVDTSVSNAAPAGVYQNERYGRDFTYTFAVPAGTYRVRLHFAEVFDGGIGDRLENIYLNHRPVIRNLDILSAAGGKDKALVKEFSDVRPDQHGNISIRITTTPESPDKNAKISGIEILKQDSSAAADAVRPFAIQTADGKTTININTSEAPDLTDWAEHTLAPVLAEWYPKIAAMLPSPDYTAPTNFTVTIRPMNGVAYTAGINVDASAEWCRKQIQGEAVGSIIHELVHVVQQYGRHESARNPGWLVEGTADYVRWFKYEPQSHGADVVWMKKHRNFSPHYNDSYRVTANFLDWVSEKYDQQIVEQMNAAMREGKYSESLWKDYTGKPLPELGDEWQKVVEAQLASGN